jgi:NAD(P)-dependent dehydrogenase (short-subunit alcohol dehydrogenase family)
MADGGRLADRIAVITGNAHGIGRARAELFAAEGTVASLGPAGAT